MGELKLTHWNIGNSIFKQIIASTGKRTAVLILFCFLWYHSLTAQCSPIPESIKGSVYIDFDYDGSFSAGDELASNVVVSAYDADGNKVAETTSSSDSGFVLDNLEDGQIYRIEFSGFGGNQIGHNSGNGTNVQFVMAPVCDIAFGLQQSSEYCDDNPQVAVSCFVRGEFESYQDYPTVVGVEHNFNPASPISMYITKEETGSIWGLVWRQKSQQLFTSAFVKQYTPLSPHGIGAIFSSRFSNSGEITTELFVDLVQEGVDLGALGITDEQDCTYGGQVGKVGLGGLALSADKDFLYAVNIFKNELIRIPVANPTEEYIDVYSIPDPGCSDGQFRAFAITERNELIYVGVTCTAETSKDENDSKAVIYEFDQTDQSFTEIFTTNYIKGYWKDNQVQGVDIAHWFTDMSFTDEGNIVISLTDRLGHIFCNAGSGRLDFQYPDILVVWNDNGTWKLENNGMAGPLTGKGVGNGQGPGGGEFFSGEYWPANPILHYETALGSVFALSGTGEVIATAYDPMQEAYSGGLLRFRTSDGEEVDSMELYTRTFNPYLGKATGFGDMDALCVDVNIEIGNFVWFDENDNGIQDPGEGPIEGLQISLYNVDCQLIGRTFTDEKGEYYFNDTNVDLNDDGEMDGLDYESQYYIVVDDDRYDSGTQFMEIEGTNFMVTLKDIGAPQSPDATDSDVEIATDLCDELNGYPVVSIVTGGSGENNYDFDLGFTDSFIFDLALRKVVQDDRLYCIGEEVIFDIYIFNQGNVGATSIQIVDYLNDSFDWPDDNPNWDKVGDKAVTLLDTYLAPGDSTLTSITLTINADAVFGNMSNFSEIKGAKDAFGNIAVDIDSSPDDDLNNDIGSFPAVEYFKGPKSPVSSTDDWINDDGTLDEDDHDPASIRILDLALRKVVTSDASEFLAGQTVDYNITVYNQGNEDAQNIVVTDFFPKELLFDGGVNPGWAMKTDSTLIYNIPGIVPAGSSFSIDLSLQIAQNFMGGRVINYAEISSEETVNGGISKDFDSVPNDDMTDDEGGEPGTDTDDEIDDHGEMDEDDHDPAVVVVRTLDLALYKTANKKSAKVGDLVTFTINVVNQGTAIADNIRISDYLGNKFKLQDGNWQTDPEDASGKTVYRILSASDGSLPLLGLLPGEMVSTTIKLKIKNNIEPGDAINRAEISGVTDEVGTDITGNDIDSKADKNKNNDCGGQVDTSNDDEINETCPTDEDDADPARVSVIDVRITTMCKCLHNATLTTPGQFRDVITITGEPGRMWQLHANTGFLDPMDPMMEMMIGTILDENPSATVPGLSDYTIMGYHNDGEGYSVSFIDSEGSIESISNPGCDYKDINIDGDFGICQFTEVNYEVISPNPGSDYKWSLPLGGGNFVGGDDSGPSVEVEWTGTGVYEIAVEDLNPKCHTPVIRDVQVGEAGGSLVCFSNTNLSLDWNCEVEVTAEMIATVILAPNAEYQVMLIDEHGNVIPGNILTGAHIGKHITAKLIDVCSGNSCWGYIIVEDKIGPSIQCPIDPIIVECEELDNYLPVAEDCSGDPEIILVGESVIKEDCESDFLKTIVRTYKAIDKYGNESELCDITIKIQRLNLDDVVGPDDFLIADNRALTCNAYPLDENGHPDPKATGVPKLDGKPLYPNIDSKCLIVTYYLDEVLFQSDCITKIVREWVVAEGCTPVTEIKRFLQTIEIVDPIAPKVKCPHDITVSTNGYTCDQIVELPLPEITDNCADEFLIEVIYDGGFIPDFKGGSVKLSDGVHEITYRVFDECHNYKECTFTVTVEDLSPPVTICDQHTIIGLPANTEQVDVWASVIDDGSYDDCGLKKMLINRGNNDCNCVYPKFEQYDYLGSFDGHHYYLANDAFIGKKAFKMAEALGGYVAVIESAEEDHWVFNKVQEIEEKVQYWIGLTDRNHEGVFEWQNGADVVYTNWQGNMPNDLSPTQDYVKVPYWDGGKWYDTNGNDEYRFVLEVEDACGWTEMTKFCCADIGRELMVGFRAIDKWGNYSDCMVEVEIQDKFPPYIECPPDLTIACEFDYTDINIFGKVVEGQENRDPIIIPNPHKNLLGVAQTGSGIATQENTYPWPPQIWDGYAEDNCDVEIMEDTPTDNRNQCGYGDIIRHWKAWTPGSTDTVWCSQYITFYRTEGIFDPTDPDEVTPPGDVTLTDICFDLGDTKTTLSPDIYGRPLFYENECDLVGVSYEDKVYNYFEDSIACLKVLREWSIIDWCEYDDDFEPLEYYQVFKVINTIHPEIELGNQDPDVCTFDDNCIDGYIELTASATDDCTPGEELFNQYKIDLYIDGIFDDYDTGKGDFIDVSDEYPIGTHLVIYTFEDRCGNKTSEQQIFTIRNCKDPTAACIDGLAVAIEPMDTDGDNIPDTEMACLWASDFDASSFHPCGYDIEFSFSSDWDDKQLCVDCFDIGLNEIMIWVTDVNGNQDYCTTTLDVQDNNDEDLCPSPKDCINFPEAQISIFDCLADYDPETIGSETTVDIDCSCDEYTITYLDLLGTNGDGCMVIQRTWTVTFLCDGVGPCDFVQTILIYNDIPPGITCPDEIVTDSDDTVCNGYVMIGIPTSESLCNTEVTITHDSPYADNPGEDASGTYPVGTTTVTFTATDKCGNTSTCQVDVTVDDVGPPSCMVKDITINLGENGMAMIEAEDLDNGSEDACDGTELLFEIDIDKFTCSDLGDNVVVVTVTDSEENSSTCTATVTVEESLEPICMAMDITISLDESGMATITVEDIDDGSIDGCGGGEVNLELDKTDFDCNDVGMVVVTLKVTDNENNMSTCTATVTVVDEEEPICIAQDVTVYLNNEGFVVLDPEEIDNGSSDACGNIVDKMVIPDTLYCENLGVNQVTLKVTDDSGNMSTCTANATVVDTIAPICIPQDVTVTLDENGEAILDPEQVDGGSFDECGGDVTLMVTPDELFCNDIGTRTYTLKVTDESGNMSTCTGNVTIEDERAPRVTCPNDITIGCEDPIDDLSIYGEPMIDEECGVMNIEEEVFMNISICNIGIITRTFTITDNAGNQTQCTQIITITGPDDPLMESDITWPPAEVILTECDPPTDPEDLDNGFPVVDENDSDCALISIEYEDVNLNPPGSCPDTLQRTWTVVDSCQLTGDGVTGIFMFVQNIIVLDEDPPELTVPMDMTLDIQTNGVCDTLVTGLISSAVDCDMNVEITNDSPYADDMNSANASGNYPVGETIVTVTATDNCGNTSTGQFTITVTDTGQATYECIKTVNDITDDGTVDIGISIPTNISQAGCVEEDIITAAYSRTDMTDTVRTFDCTMQGDIDTRIWFFENGMLIDSCNILITIQDGNGFCLPFNGEVEINGLITTESGDGVLDVGIDLKGSGIDKISTDDRGEYAFLPMPSGGSYDLIPGKNNDLRNGLSTLDLILIQNHILGIQSLDSPYKLIAADVNKSNSITVLDMVELRKIILGNNDQFSNNESWRMVDAGYEFIKPENPLGEDFPENYNIDLLNSDMTIDFVGIKIGDVNNSVKANQYMTTEIRSNEELSLKVVKELVTDEIIEYKFYGTNYRDIRGMQFTLEYDYSNLKYIAIGPGVLEVSKENIGLRYNKEGRISFSYHKSEPQSFERKLVLFSLLFEKLQNADDVIELGSSVTQAEAYNLSDILNIGLEEVQDENSLEFVELYQNKPNPWSSQTSVEFFIPEEMDVDLRLYDINGRFLKSYEGHYQRGKHQVQIYYDEIGVSGLIYYELQTPYTRLMHKMLILR